MGGEEYGSDMEVLVKVWSVEVRGRAGRTGFAAHGDIIGTGVRKGGRGFCSADDSPKLKLSRGTPRHDLPRVDLQRLVQNFATPMYKVSIARLPGPRTE